MMTIALQSVTSIMLAIVINLGGKHGDRAAF